MSTRILIACGSGIATSGMAAEKLKNIIRDRGYDWKVEAVDMRYLKSLVRDADLVLTLAPYEKVDYGIPVVNGLPLITGAGLEQCIQEIRSALAERGEA